MAFSFNSRLNVALTAKDQTARPMAQAARALQNYGLRVTDTTLNLQMYSQRLDTVASSLRKVSNSLDVTAVASTRAFQLDRQTRELAAQMGLGSTEANRMSNSILGLSNATGVSTQVTGQLVNALAATGQSLTDLSPRLAGYKNELTAINDGAAQEIETLTDLVGRYNMSAQGAAQLSAETRLMGTTITDLADRTSSWQAQFQMPGMLAALPGVVDHARKSLTNFSRSVVGGAAQIIESTLKTGAIYAKTFGVDMVQAIAEVEQHQNHFMKALQQDSDVYLGLEKNFSALTLALMETGVGMDEINDLMQKGKDDPLAFAEGVQSMERQLEQIYGPGSVQLQRFHRQMIENSSEAAKRLIADENALGAAQAARRRSTEENNSSIGKASTTFHSMTGAMRGTAGAAVETFTNLLTLGKTLVGLTFAEDAASMFGDLNKTLKGLNARILEFAMGLREDPGFQKWQPYIRVAGKAVIGFGVALGALASGFTALSSVFAVWRPIALGAQMIERSGSRMLLPFRLLGRVGGLFTGLVAKLFYPLQAIRAIATGLGDIGEAFKDPNLTGAQKFTAVLRGVFVGAVDFIDKLLLGIPSFIVRKFFPGMGDSLADGMRKLFNRMTRQLTSGSKRSLGDMFRSAVSYVGQKLNDLRTYVFENLGTWRATATEWARNIGRAIGGMAKMAWDLLKELFVIENWKTAWNNVVGFFQGEGASNLSNTFWDIMSGLGQVVSDATIGLIDEIARPFGSGFEEIREQFNSWADEITNAWDVIKTVLGDQIYGIWLKISAKAQEGLFILKDTMATVWDGIKKSTAKAIGGLIGATLGPLMRSYADAVFAIREAEYAITGDDAMIIAATAARDRLKNMAGNFAETLAANTQAAIETSRISTEENRVAMEASLRATTEFERTSGERRQANWDAMNARRATRETTAANRRSETARRIEERDRRRGEEATRFEEARAKTLSDRGTAATQIGALMRVLQEGLADAQSKNNTRRAERIQGVIDQQAEFLEDLQDATNPAAVQEVLDHARRSAGRTATQRAGLPPQSTPPQPTTPLTRGAAPPRAVEGAAPRTTVPTPSPPPSPGAMRVDASGRLEVAWAPGAERLLEIRQSGLAVRAGLGQGGTA